MEFTSVGVVGSGVMAAGVAEVCAGAASSVTVRARSDSAAQSLLAALDASLARSVAKGRLDPDEAADLRRRVTVTTDLSSLAACQLVIESVVEEMSVKRELFDELDRVADADAILATNTSTLSVTDLAMETRRPERVCGLHFFNPAPVMPLVEVVRTLCVDDATIDAAEAFARACGKEPIVVADRAGFVVNDLLFPYLNHAVRLLETGVASREGIDQAMVGGCGFPMGPLALLDLIGLDTALAILSALHAEYSDAAYLPAPLLRRLVSTGRLGRKSGRGFYDYGD
ncbi:MAG TPA: 3-hydroxybutyryl-CoA dehydrogenase [Acidimicrobiales bacterium]|nr:3-hydroxybutyryl-CoA dehydrogenase [Acidimicrobiales bacterium]